MKELNLEYFKNNLENVKKRLLENLSEDEYNKGIEILRLGDEKHEDGVIDKFIELKLNRVLNILYTKEQVNDLKSVITLKKCIYYANDKDVKITVENIPTSQFDEQKFIVFEYECEYVYINPFTHSISFEEK